MELTTTGCPSINVCRCLRPLDLSFTRITSSLSSITESCCRSTAAWGCKLQGNWTRPLHILLWLICLCCNWLKGKISNTNRVKGCVSATVVVVIPGPVNEPAFFHTCCCCCCTLLYLFCHFFSAPVSAAATSEFVPVVGRIRLYLILFLFIKCVCAFVCVRGCCMW